MSGHGVGSERHDRGGGFCFCLIHCYILSFANFCTED
jgi:hypothetical protein